MKFNEKLFSFSKNKREIPQVLDFFHPAAQERSLSWTHWRRRYRAVGQLVQGIRLCALTSSGARASKWPTRRRSSASRGPRSPPANPSRNSCAGEANKFPQDAEMHNTKGGLA